MYQGNDKITICDHPLIKHKTTVIRKEETGTNEFRKIVEEISVLFCEKHPLQFPLFPMFLYIIKDIFKLFKTKTYFFSWYL